MVYIYYKEISLCIALPQYAIKTDIILKYLNKNLNCEITEMQQSYPVDFAIAYVYNPLEYIYKHYIAAKTTISFASYCYQLIKTKSAECQLHKLTDADNYMNYDVIVYENKMTDTMVMTIIKYLCKYTKYITLKELYDMKNEIMQQFPFDYMMHHTINTIKMTSIIYWRDFKYFNLPIHQIIEADLPKYREPLKMKPQFTLITPTIGRRTLKRLLFTLEMEEIPMQHFILWDNKRSIGGLSPHDCRGDNIYNYEFTHPHDAERADVWLRALGVFMADSDFYGFFDEDTFPMRNHLAIVADAFNSNPSIDYVYCKRIMWEHIEEKQNNRNADIANGEKENNILFCRDNYRKIGVDDFEAIGKMNKLGYRLFDNSSLYMRKDIARAVAANIYMNNQIYGDDRLIPDYLDKIGAKGIILEEPLINHISRDDLVNFFKANILPSREI